MRGSRGGTLGADADGGGVDGRSVMATSKPQSLDIIKKEFATLSCPIDLCISPKIW